MSKTAKLKIIRERTPNGAESVRYRFFCELSGMAVYTTEPYITDDPESKVHTVWENECKANFNLCHKCGRWVCSAMYNADVLECVECTPWENKPNYCPSCGKKVSMSDIYCSKCGMKLQYGKVDDK